MFTGLIDDVGRIEAVSRTAAGLELRISCRYDDLVEGESIAVNGACLTVLAHGNGWFTVGAITTTLGRTTIGSWDVGRRVNLERALRAGDRLGGHFVQGHVDGVARVTAVAVDGDAQIADLALPAGLAELMVQHGSLAVDGVSLTVNAVNGPRFEINVIPHTRAVTTLGSLVVGSRVNLEVDMIARYVERLAAFGSGNNA